MARSPRRFLDVWFRVEDKRHFLDEFFFLTTKTTESMLKCQQNLTFEGYRSYLRTIGGGICIFYAAIKPNSGESGSPALAIAIEKKTKKRKLARS